MKKGDLSINVIIVSVIGLIVLVVLIAIFSGQMSKWVSGVDNVKQSCVEDAHGQIVLSTDSCPAGMRVIYNSYKDVDSTHKCCVPISG